MPPAGFKPTIPASERPQTQALDGVATGVGISGFSGLKFKEETSKVLHLKHNSMVLKLGHFGKYVRSKWTFLKCGGGRNV